MLDKTFIPQMGSSRSLWSRNLDLQPIDYHWSPLHGEKSWNVCLQKLNFSASEERKTWTSWMTLGQIIRKCSFWKWSTPFINTNHDRLDLMEIKTITHTHQKYKKCYCTFQHRWQPHGNLIMCEDTMATNISVIQWSNYNDRSQGTQPRSLIRTDHWMNWVIFSRVWPADPFLLPTCICLAPDPSLICTQSPSSILRLNIHCHVHIWCLKMMDCDSLKPDIKTERLDSLFLLFPPCSFSPSVYKNCPLLRSDAYYAQKCQVL